MQTQFSPIAVHRQTAAPIKRVAHSSHTASPRPTEHVELSAGCHVAEPKSKTGLVKAGMALGLLALVGVGATGCTSLQTYCGPSGCVTTEVYDPGKTAAAAVGAAIILDAIIEDGHHQGHHGHHGHGHHCDYGANWHSHDGGWNYHCH